jgi:iron complex outermembrane receptor protein
LSARSGVRTRRISLWKCRKKETFLISANIGQALKVLMRIRATTVLLLFLGFILPQVAAAQSVAVIGNVDDPQGGVIVGATVTLTPVGAVRPVTARTDAKGAFSLSGPPGRYTLQIDSPGFATWTREIVVAAGMAPVKATLEIPGLLEDVHVSGTAPYNLTKPIPTASRIGLSPLETPASVSVVSGDLIRSLETPTLIVAKSLAPGITSSAPMGNGGNVLTARGFTGANSVKQLYNGMEIYNAGNVVAFPFDPWNVDFVGVLSGPASVLYGTGAIGGAVNVVPRRPDPTQRRNEVQFGAGRFDTYHEAIDSTGPLSARVSYRFDASFYNSGHWVDSGDSNSQAVSGSIRFDATKNLRFTVSNDFGNQNPSKYLGTPIFNDAPVAGTRFVNYNVLDAKLKFLDNWTNVETLWTPSPSMSFHNSTFYLYNTRLYHDAPNYAYVPATNKVQRTGFRDIQDTYETQYGDTGYLKQSGRVFGLANDALIGFDLNRNYYHRNDNVRGGTSLVDALNPSDGNYLDFYNQTTKPFYLMHVNQIAGFAEDRLHLTHAITVAAGLRFDHYHINRYDALVLTTAESNSDASGWNAGLVVEPIKDLALYAQYAEASDPVNSLSSITAAQQGFHLSPGRQVEVGVKQTIMNGRAEWTVAVYDLMKKDLLTPAVNNPTLTDQVGQQSSRGVEGSLAFTAGVFRVNLNGTVLRARFDDFNAVVSNRVVQLAGNVPLNVPEQSANAMLFWSPTPAWEARSVMRFVGRRFADNTNTTAIMPSYKVVDFGVRWRARPRLSIDARLDNAFDEIYPDSGTTTQWLLGSPRSATVSLNLLF